MQVQVDAARDDDSADILRIVDQHNLPVAWAWTPGSFGTVARFEGRVVAFLAMHETPFGLIVDELWQEKSRAGFAGLGALAEWVEEVARRIAKERNEAISVGGICMDANTAHRAALERRGYAQVASVLSRRFEP
uniref:N-acetyltransferase domain-containing protein n=1 Tax=mine drainage metagenome TaxID=410659 RepID=E6QP68_9ZZZZ